MRPFMWGFFRGFRAVTVWGWTAGGSPGGAVYKGGAAKVVAGGLAPSFNAGAKKPSGLINPASGGTKVEKR